MGNIFIYNIEIYKLTITTVFGILYSVLSLWYGICGDIFRLLYMYFDSSFLPPWAPDEKNSRTTPQNHMQPLLEEESFGYFLVLVVCLKKEKISLISVWMVSRALSQTWNLSGCACVYLREEETEYVPRVANIPSFSYLRLKRAEGKKGDMSSNAVLVTQAHTRVTAAFFTYSQLFGFILSSVLHLGFFAVI